MRAHRLAHAKVRGAHVTRHVDIGDIERAADLVEAERLAILGQLALHAQQRRRQQIAEAVLIFHAVHPPARRPTLAPVLFLPQGSERLSQSAEERRFLRACGARFSFGGISPALTRSWTFTQMR